MSEIILTMNINAPAERVFDLARSIDFHQATMSESDEKAVEGVTSGLIGLGEEVTWEAKHFGIRQRLRVKITQFDRPRIFQDRMTEGIFKFIIHDHRFEDHGSRTLMTDRFEFKAPFGILGTIVEKIFLKNYMQNLLLKRNLILKEAAEGEDWKKYLGSQREK